MTYPVDRAKLRLLSLESFFLAADPHLKPHGSREDEARLISRRNQTSRNEFYFDTDEYRGVDVYWRRKKR